MIDKFAIMNQVPAGSMLIVHASFKPLAEAGYTPDQIIGELMERLSPGGTLMMPTFTYSYAGIWNVEPFDPASTPGAHNGVLSETFRRMPGVRRTGNPTYSVAVWGKYADKIMEESRDDAGLGHNSSYEVAMRLGAQILLLNVGNNRNSMLHYAEAASELPYNDIPFRECWGRTASTVRGELALAPEFPACSEAFAKFDRQFVEAGIAVRQGDSFLVDAPAMLRLVLDEIKRKPDCMLCDDFTCEPCTLRKKRLREAGLI